MRHDSRGKGNHSPFKNEKEGSLRRLQKSNSIDECNAAIQAQLKAEIVERAPPSVEGREFYIPHEGVVLENAESTKLRIVYYASGRAWSGAKSLKECLNTGSPLQNKLWSVLAKGHFTPWRWVEISKKPSCKCESDQKKGMHSYFIV